MNKSTLYALKLLLAFVWASAVVILYYLIHKPINIYFVRNFGGALLDLGSAALFLIVAGGLGRRLSGFIEPMAALSRVERGAAQAMIGLGALGVLIFGVGLISLSLPAMLILLLGLLALNGRLSLAWLGEMRAALSGLDPKTRWGRPLLIFIGANLSMALFMALTPPTKFDSLTYQLLGPKLAVINGRFEAFSGSHFFGFPQLVNTLYAGQMALLDGRITAGAALHWVFGLLLLIAAGGYAARRFGAWVGLLAAAFVLTSTSLWLSFGWAYVDLATAACGMLAFIMLDQWRVMGETEPKISETARSRWLVLAAIFIGLAMSAKYNTLILALVSGLYVLGYSWRDGLMLMLRRGAILVGVAALVLLPWLVRNAAFFDNPFYPFGLHTYEWDDLKSDWYTAAEQAPLRVVPQFVAPILIGPTLIGIEGGEDYFNATNGPIYLLLIPLLLLTWRNIPTDEKRVLRGLLFLVLLYHAFWLVTAGLSRYGGLVRFVYPMFGWLAVLAAASLDHLRRLPRKPFDFAWVMRTIVALILVFTLVDHVIGQRGRGSGLLEGTTTNDHFIASRSLEYLSGALDEGEYLEDALGWFAVMNQTLNDLPDGAQILFFWETRSLYCDEPRITCIEDTVLYRWWHERRTVGDGSNEALLAAWRARDISHILVWEDGRKFEFDANPRLTAEDAAAWEALTAELEIVWQGSDVYTLYTLSPEAISE